MNNKGKKQKAIDSAYFNTDSGPATAPDEDSKLPAHIQARAKGETAQKFAHNPDKIHEYNLKPDEVHTGSSHSLEDPRVGYSTLSESNVNNKNGAPAKAGVSQPSGKLDGFRADGSGQPMTTNQGTPVPDNQNSLKAGARGPALLKDFVLREKLTHFDHERIPERVVHARGSAAHGFFECYKPLTDLTCAALFSESGKKTPVFVRFSTVAGERGSKDTARDARGFAIKFYTEQGNWDLVGNNIPVFFIQDAMKFPDLVHAVKPEPHHGMPQAASAHDTFWDFVSLMPESMHMLMWIMSDRGIPRSYRMMQGFGVHTFRFVNARGESRLVKFHWNPILGTHSHTWEEAVKISGADPDYHRRDLWEAIEQGQYPEWELGVQIFTEEQAEDFSFDVLDATKLIPEELIPVTPIGRLVLNRNPDNFFAETEQVAFCAAHVVPGIDFTNDPLLAGRIHSYVDTQILRLCGMNFHELPINAPLAPVHNNQRDGIHRQAIHHGSVAYEPNSLNGGCPFQTGKAGFISFPEPIEGYELRGKSEKFAEHYNQAKLFWESQYPDEKRHIINAFRFELSKVTVPAIRSRTVSMLRNVSDELAGAVAKGLGITAMPDPMPLILDKTPVPEISESDALTLHARPGSGTIATRKIAILVETGINPESINNLASSLIAEHAIPRIISARIGEHKMMDGSLLDADASFENNPGTLFDGVIIPDGEGINILIENDLALELIRDQFRHLKTIFAIGNGKELLHKAGINSNTEIPGLIISKQADSESIDRFIGLLAQHKHPQREENISSY
ncbi:catalase [Nitrosomonas sp.]|uniref:catalase n=1 Tax=Nitrosomonas sp. TaxID=42353 RepID=UPI0033068EBA